MNRYVLIALAGALLIGGTLAWWLARDSAVGGQPSAPLTMQENSGSAQPPAPVEEQASAAGEQRPERMSPAKRIRHGSAIEQDLASTAFELPPSGNEKVDRINTRVEAALEGDIDELIDMTRMINRCGRGMDSEDQMLARLERAVQAHSRNPDGPIMPARGGGPGSGGGVQYQSFEDMEAEMWARFDECQVVKQVLNETLYEQVSRLAETGLPSARYLYAVWPPAEDSLLTVDTLALLEYQSLALEYTWMNMQERDPLGLLAMSQSYGASRPSMFTPRNALQSQVFRLASMKCGVDNEWLSERALNFGQGFGRFQSRNTGLPSRENDAAALAEMFCPLVPEDE